MADAAQAAGSITSGVAGYETGKYNQKVAKTNAINADRDGVADVGRIRDAARMAMGEQVAAQGSNGFAIGSGSALDAIHQSAVNAQLDELTVRRAAAAKARGLRVEGALARAAGDNALISGIIGAGGKMAGSSSPTSPSGGGGNGDWAGSFGYGGGGGNGWGGSFGYGGGG